MKDQQRFSVVAVKKGTKRPESGLYQGAMKQIGIYSGNIDDWFGKGSAKAIMGYQKDLGLKPDGWSAGATSTPLIKQAIAAGYEPPLLKRIQALISLFEGSLQEDMYGMTSVISDGAGANYGFMQCNRHGSVKALLRLAGREDLIRNYYANDVLKVNPTIKDFFGSVEGIKAQTNYFEQRIVEIAMRQLREFGIFNAWENDPAMKVYWERAVLLFCDTVIQNGTMWSGSRKPFWKGLKKSEKSDPKGYKWPELYYGTWWNKMLGQHLVYGEDNESGLKGLWWEEYESHGGTPLGSMEKEPCKAANQSAAKKICTELIPDTDPQSKLGVIAHFRSRTSWDKYWFQAVGSRRITDAYGASTFHPSKVVNGSIIDLAKDYYIGVPALTPEEVSEESDLETSVMENRDKFYLDFFDECDC